MKRSAVLLFSILFAAGAVAARAQVAAAATARQFSITAGGMVSIFQPDFEGDWQSPSYQYPVAHTSPDPLFGAGAYVDVKFTRWVQLEAEGRWLRFNQYGGISQDNYLIGPRIPVFHFWRSSVYAKALGGYAKMNFDSLSDNGSFTDLAFGGGMDVKLTKRLSLRAVDFEYQYYPRWSNSSLSPYGASVGIGYKIF
jgi:hypothetical protein